MSFRKSKNSVDEWRALCDKHGWYISQLARLAPLFSNASRFDEFLKIGVFSHNDTMLTIMSLTDEEWPAFSQLVDQFSTDWQSYFVRSEYCAYYADRDKRSWRPATAGFDRRDLQRPRLVVHFWARWDAHDRVLDENLRHLMNRFPQLTFRSLEVDIPHLRDVCLAAKVVSVPAIGLYRNGHVDRFIVGVRPSGELVDEIARWMETA